MVEPVIPGWWYELPEEVRDDVIVRACFHAFIRYSAHFPEYDFFKHTLIELVKDKREMQVQLNRLAQLQPPPPIIISPGEKSEALKGMLSAIEDLEMDSEMARAKEELAMGPEMLAVRDRLARNLNRPWWQRPRWFWNLWDRWRYGV